MKKMFFVWLYLFFITSVFAQAIHEKIKDAFQQFENDAQLKHAISSLYVIEAKTGKVVFDKNSEMGLAPASTQKIVTGATAFELLGKDYRYKTEFFYSEGLHVQHDNHFGILPSGDPTFGSWRYESTKSETILKNLFKAFNSKVLDNKSRTEEIIFNALLNETPDGWIWQDIGNYYGAPPSNLNWQENQYNLVFSSGKTGEPTNIIEVQPTIPGVTFNNQVISGSPGTGDNAYIYFSPYNDTILIKGTIPPDQKSFSIAGSMPDPGRAFLAQLAEYTNDSKRISPFELKTRERPYFGTINDMLKGTGPSGSKSVYTHYSPPLDSIVYWFFKKSINLYGEALIKTFNTGKNGLNSRDTGIANLKRFWKDKGLDEDELNIYDGSGLSPLNRITTHAQVEVLKYAKTKNWFPYFYDALPDYNGMKMKSGTISGVKGFCGYHKAKDGKEYIFSFLVNNFSGPSSGLVNKMYKVLDVLK